MKYLYLVILDDHFDYGLSQWLDNNKRYRARSWSSDEDNVICV
jgi:hypothetical protein